LYPRQKLQHALAALLTAEGINLKKGKEALPALLQQSIATREWMVKSIYESRAKDYNNPFRQMVYGNLEEMNKVTGKLEDNSFIRQEQEAMAVYRKTVRKVLSWLK
jgi:hypothetical protein